ncbi:MAG: preprotein translocase subunit SecE [Ruminococcaceae bacterium]|nr:preprotein translocase subunit SecE [Oscillospiraceae bacterium]
MAEVVREKKANIFVRTGKKISGFFKGIFSELKKVSWPSRKQVFNNTVSVLVFCLVIGVVIWAADFLFKFIIGLLFA